MAFTSKEFEILTDKTLLLLIILDKEGKILKTNKRSRKILDIPTSDDTSLYLQNIVVDADKEKCKKIIKELVNQKYLDLQSLRFHKFSEQEHLLAIKFDFIYHNNLIYATGIDTSSESVEHIALSTLSEVTHTGAWHYNPVSDKIYFSEEFHHTLSLQPDKFFDKETIQQGLNVMNKNIKNILTSREILDYVHKAVTKENNEKYYRVIGKPVVHRNRVIFINGTVSDVSEQIRNINLLKKNEETKSLALKGIKSGLFDHNLETDLVFYSKEFRKMLGLPIDREHVPESQFREMIHPNDVEAALNRHLYGLQKEGNLYYNYFRLKQKDSQYRHYEVYGYRKKDKEGKAIRMIGNLIDVHERRVNEQLVAENQSRLYAMINNGFTYTILLDTEGRILMADQDSNNIIIRDYKIDPSETLVKFIDVMPVNFKNSFAHEFNEALKGEVVKKEVERMTYKGSAQWLEAKYTPIFNTENRISSILISFHDITELKNAEISIKEAHIKERELSNLKSNILSNFSHEIRTPLNGIITISDLLLNQKWTEEDKPKLLQHLEESKNRLLETMNSLSHFSEMDTIREFLNFGTYDINYAVETSFREYKHVAKAKNLTYILTLEEECPVTKMDETIFRTALNNLIHNAIKYTEEGEVHVTVNQPIETKIVKISIKDTGIGIASENLDKIFDPFVQESLGLSRKYEGTGIGLSLSKKYVELLGGTIKVKSKRNQGSEFIMSIPLTV